jgi:hypothetical protein
MKLAEALIARADLQKKISQLVTRMQSNAKVQEGEVPAEDVAALMDLFEYMSAELEGLVKLINRTNGRTTFGDGTLTDAIAERDSVRSRITAYRALCDEAAIKQDRYSRSEVKYVRCVDMAQLQHTIDALSKRYRELDTAIQAANWTTETAS